jgi:hypothetical protein
MAMQTLPAALNRSALFIDTSADAISAVPRNEGKMTIPTRSIAFSADLTAMPASRWIAAAAILAAATVPHGVDAKAARIARAGAYDGVWNVAFATQAGSCSSNSFPFNVSGTRVSSAGGGKVSGGISRAGIVSVNVSVGLSHASGNGRLAGNSGSGRWNGIISGDKCSGSWQATRS